ncbi:receptor-like protein 19 isoform X1 [Cryptomeria japonica]|uniref:receptor-like protein 19 isoform X1 n=1 Tax=Cryptomeria japonica TaxID=3369 RepID=UPI0027DA7B96|nr:receptor-like protein 19 isoform X1 [Cryptomeria japonica]
MKMGLGIWVVLLLLPIICCSACFEDERKSLLDFKKGLNFTSSYRKLESWRGLNCCAWEGVGCHPRTAHVLSLDLHFFEWSEIRGGLFQLLNLEHLDLSENNLTMAGDTLLRSIASLTNLTTITMASCGLSGEIPPSFANLSRLQRLDLSGNSLRGKIPAFGGSLPLSEFYLSDNNLEGSLPSSLGGKLNGTIPSTLSNISTLWVLYLHDNSLIGPIPTSFGKLSKLGYLDLSNNRLNGTFSFFILNNCPKLDLLDLSGNMLTIKVNTSVIPKFQLTCLALHQCNIRGNFPTFVSTQYVIEYLDLSNNSLSGFIPNWLWEITSLFHIDLSNNLFDGSIPKYVDLDFLSLAKNNLSGSILDSIFESESLSILDLSNNRLSGRIPQCLKNCANLSTLNLEKNNLNGMIPNLCKRMSSLEVLKLGDNALEGQVTSWLGNCKSLKILDLRNNNLQGNISDWIKRLHNLQVLSLKNNKFNDEIPLQLNKLQNLQILDLSNNNFLGSIPIDFMKLTAMANQSENKETLQQEYRFNNIYENYYYVDEIIVKNKGRDMEFAKILRLVKCLDLSNNNLSGNIPKNIGSLKGLVILNISRNNFNGEIPKFIGDMILLESLDLSQNKLSGAIPTELQFLTSLSYFDVSYNYLSGMIPQGGQMMTFDSAYFSNNLGLCGLQIYVSCLSNPPDSPKEHEENDEDIEDDIWWDVGMATGYVISFSIVMGMLWVNKTCSIMCFKFMDGIIIGLFQTM